jgi:hypothetical protein
MFRVITGQSRVPRAEREAWPCEVPWSLVEPWRARIEATHSQTLERLNERGGLGPDELWLAAHGHGLFKVKVDEREAASWLLRVLASHTAVPAI